MKPEIKQRIEQINNGIVPDGYKKTEFGVFPCDWVTDKTIDNVCQINPKTGNLPEKFIYLDLESVLDRKIVEKQIIEKHNAPSRAQRVLLPNDIIYQVVRPYQKNNFFFRSEDKEYKTVASTGYALLRSKMQSFLFQLVHSDYFVNQVNVKCTGTNYPAINGDDLSKVKVAYPTNTKEQEKIAEILMKWDEAIELQEEYIEKLIVKKDKIIHELLRPQKDWIKTTLSKVLIEKSERTKINNQHQDLSSTKLGLVAQSDYFDKQVASEDNIGYKIIHKDDIVISPQNLWLGNINYNDKFRIGIVSPSYKTFEVNKEYDKLFIATLMKTPRMLNQYILSSEQGASVVRRNLNMDLFYAIPICVPCLEEQRRISRIIKTIQSSYKLEKEKLDAIKQQRKALQQYLLNGIVRVPK